jgi:DNA-binding winged helix-turn-helix (wHTH) protein
MHNASGVFRFGVFEVDLRTGELRRQGLRVRLPSQSFQVLRLLLEHPGEMVSRQQLREELWLAETFVDFNHGVNAAVNRLREALGDAADSPRFVETLPRRGYRFIARVDQVPTTTDPTVPDNAVELRCHDDAMRRDLAQSAEKLTSDLSRQSAAVIQPRTLRRTPILVAVIALCVGAGVMAWSTRRNAKVRWARHDVLPEIVRLADADRFDDAYRLAQQVQPLIPDDQLLVEQMRGISRRAIIESDPVGGEVFYRPYARSGEPWRPLGKAPVESEVPRGLMHWKIEMAGREMAEDIGPGPFAQEFHGHFKLFHPNQVPPGMVRIASSDEPFHIFMPGLEHLSEVQLPDYWIDRHEVTNRAFKRFVDEGGYRRPELWQEPFVKDGRPLTFEAAMAHFRDTTDRPGPAGWEMSTYVAGQDDYPVGGVSWYEAAAFARWAGKALPTIYHWARAADLRLSGDVVPASNADGKSLRAVGAMGGITRGGTTDMAGNVKEWVSNSTGSKRYVLGGAWNEPVYMFTTWDAQSPFTRRPNSGFRCIKVDRPEDLSPALTAVIHTPSRDVRSMKPVSSAVFEAWRSLYSFDHGDLKVKAEFVNDTSPDWRMEKVSYAAAYGDERILAYLFLPKNAKPPYQVMIGFSGGTFSMSGPALRPPISIDLTSSCGVVAPSFIPSTRARSSVVMRFRTTLLI